MSKNIKWICENDNVEIKNISNVETKFNVKFPEDYIEVVAKNDGGYPIPNRFDLNNHEEVFNNLLSFDEEDSSNIVDAYNCVKEMFIGKVVPFAEDPFGNLICFDFRNNSQPIIVFWEHEKAFIDKENSISIICNTFSDFLNMLHESKEQ